MGERQTTGKGGEDMRKVCPLTLGFDLVKHCRRGGCAWWDAARGCCGMLPDADEPIESRYWITERGLAAIGKDGQPKAKMLAEYLS